MLRWPSSSSSKSSNGELKHHWRIWGEKEPRRTWRKFYKNLYAKTESLARLPKDTALNQIEWLRDSTWPSWTRFAARCSMRAWLRSSVRIQHIMQCSSTPTSLQRLLMRLTATLGLLSFESRGFFRVLFWVPKDGRRSTSVMRTTSFSGSFRVKSLSLLHIFSIELM